ncbi:MAG: GldG family protein [Chloroflexi bacterium]|nr:GldG family protein [Chloroflexota bacterium]
MGLVNDFTQRHAGAIAFFGLFLLLMAGAYYLVASQFDLPMRILLGVSAALIVFAVMESPRRVFAAFGGRRLLYGSNTLLTILIVLGILGAVNFIAAKQSKRWDLTETKQFTLSDQTLKLIQQVNQPLKVKAFFRRDNPARGSADDLLKEYSSRNSLIEVEYIDPDLNPGAAEQLNIRYDGSVVFMLGDKRQESTNTTEAGFTTALLKLLSNEQRKVYFVTGHEERSGTDFARTGFANVKKALEDDNVKVEDLALAATGKVPDDASAVVLASPRKPYLPEEQDALRTYLKDGGRALVLRDPRGGADLNDLLREWGIELDDGIVVDPVASFMNDRVTLVANRYLSSPITQQMRALSLFPLAGQVKVLTETQGLQVTPLIQSSDQSWVEYGEEAKFDEGKDAKGPVPFAVTVEPQEPAPAPGQPAAQDAGKPKTRLMIVGDGDFASNEWTRVPGNQDFFVNGVNWLTGTEDQITIRPRPMDQRMMVLTPAQSNLVLFGSVLFLPGLVLAGGIYTWWRRR